MTDGYDYARCYYYLFNTITKAVDRLEELLYAIPPGELDTKRDISDIAHTLKAAQRAAEDLYVENVM